MPILIVVNTSISIRRSEIRTDPPCHGRIPLLTGLTSPPPQKRSPRAGLASGERFIVATVEKNPMGFFSAQRSFTALRAAYAAFCGGLHRIRTGALRLSGP